MKQIIEQIQKSDKFTDEEKAEIITKLERIRDNNEAYYCDDDELLGAFVWSRTPEGHGYWDRINDKL